MSLDKYVTILSSCIGFLSALFFALGTLRMKNEGIKCIASTYWDFNQHLADSITSQRAEYIAGSLLLLLTFTLQLVAAILPEHLEVSLLQPFDTAILIIIFSFCTTALFAWLLVRSISTRTKKAVRELFQQSNPSQETP